MIPNGQLELPYLRDFFVITIKLSSSRYSDSNKNASGFLHLYPPKVQQYSSFS